MSKRRGHYLRRSATVLLNIVTSDNRFEPLPSELRRRKKLALSEATNGFDWLDACPPEIGRKVAFALDILTNVPYRVYFEAAKRLGYASDGREFEHKAEETLKGGGGDSDRLDVLAAVIYSYVWLAENDDEEIDSHESYVSNSAPEYTPTKFIEVVNDILLHGRVEWVYEDEKFHERSNSVLHVEVVRPASILLDSDPKYAKASAGFQAAITRLSENKPDVAITDAASAVQEFFRALGVMGNSISDQLNAAQKANVITAYDRSLLKPFTDWVNGDRSERGNAHHHREGDVSKSDAWLAIHVAGALMVRLSNEEPRDIVAARDKRDADAAAAVMKAEQDRLAKEAEAAVARASNFDVWNTPSNYSDETPF
jgi:hypothetical protein